MYGLILMMLAIVSIPVTGEGTAFVVFGLMAIAMIREEIKGHERKDTRSIDTSKEVLQRGA